MRRADIRLEAWCLLGVFLGVVLAGPSKAEGLEDQVSELLRPFVEVGDFSGVVLVERDDAVVVRIASGSADPGSQRANTVESRFQVASISKQFTAAAVLQLVERGVMTLDDRLNDHLPALGDSASMTIRSLLNHSSGLGDHTAAPSFGALAETGASSGRVARMIVTELARREPGQYLYSNAGYVLLSHLVETVTEKDLGTVLEEGIFGPLGMSRTSVRTTSSLLEGQSVPLDPRGYADVAAAQQLHPSVNVGAAGLVTTAADLLRWMRAMRAGRDGADNVLRSESWKQMLQDGGNGYGLGVSVSPTRIGHDGRTAGVSASLDWYPGSSVVVVVLSNVQSGALEQLRHGVAALALGREAPEPQLRGQTAASRLLAAPNWLTPEKQVSLVGSYEFAPELVVHVSDRDGRLYAAANSGFATELIAMEEGVLFSRALYANIGISEALESGQTGELLWLGRGAPWRGPRVKATSRE